VLSGAALAVGAIMRTVRDDDAVVKAMALSTRFAAQAYASA
jgi:hypothetical protein